VCPDIADLPTHLADARPDALFAPPRMFEKLQVAIEATIEAAPDEEGRAVGRAAVEAGLTRVRAADGGREVSEELVARHENAVAVLRPLSGPALRR
jgi:long-subunit acyl-CoA synthetase (AMP-forming)